MPSDPLHRVLCVDDDEDSGEMLGLLLNEYGFELTCFRSADDAWPLIRGGGFDLFLLDSWLPKIDGFEFCLEIREFDSQTPIVFYSGAAYEADKRKGIAAGANAYVVKPDFDCLTRTMLDLIVNPRVENVIARDAEQHHPADSRSAQFLSFKTASD